MNGHPRSLPGLLNDQNPDVNLVIDTYVSRFNRYAKQDSKHGDMTMEHWQLYEFPGDPVFESPHGRIRNTRDGVPTFTSEI